MTVAWYNDYNILSLIRPSWQLFHNKWSKFHQLPPIMPNLTLVGLSIITPRLGGSTTLVLNVELTLVQFPSWPPHSSSQCSLHQDLSQDARRRRRWCRRSSSRRAEGSLGGKLLLDCKSYKCRRVFKWLDFMFLKLFRTVKMILKRF